MRNDKLLLEDILHSIDEVTAATPPTQAEFDADKYRQSHVLRHIQIIGEASWRLSQPLRDQHPQVPWKRIAAMRMCWFTTILR